MLNITFGTYFEGYEPIINALFSGEFSSQMGFTLFISTWFGLSAAISFLTHYFNSSFVYSGVCTAINLLIFTTLTSVILLLIKHKSLTFGHAVLVYLVFLFSYLESLVYVYNLRISFFCLLAALFYFNAIQNFRLSKKNYLLVFLLIFIGVFSRLEIAVVSAFIFLIFCKLFYRRAMFFTACVLIASLSVFVFYKAYGHEVYPDAEIMLNVETEFGDKESISSDDYQDQRTKLKLEAISKYIQDDDVYSISDIARFTTHRTMLEYLRYEKFPQIYKQKILALLDLLKSYNWLFFLTISIVIFTTYIYCKGKDEWYREVLKVFAFIIVLISVVLTINLLVICPHNLIVVILSACCLVCIAYLTFRFYQFIIIKHFFFILIVLQIFFLGKHFYGLHSLQEEKFVKAEALRTFMVAMSQQKKQIVFANGTQEDNYPARLFSCLLSQRVTHYYADFFLSRYPFFRKHNASFFNSNYYQMKSKITTVAAPQNNVVYLSSEGYNDFLKRYVLFFQKKEINFVPLETKIHLQGLSPYTVHLSKI